MAATAGRVALRSIHPGYAEAILAGDKHVEFRRRRLAPDVDTVVVYATKPVGAVVGLFRLAGTDVDSPQGLWERHGHHGSIARADYDAYFHGRHTAVGLRVTAARRLPAPVPLAKVGATSAPQSFSYLSQDVLSLLQPTPDDSGCRPRAGRLWALLDTWVLPRLLWDVVRALPIAGQAAD